MKKPIAIVAQQAAAPCRPAANVLTRWPLLGDALRSGHLMTGLRVVVLFLFGIAVLAGLITEDAHTGLTVLLLWGIFWPLLTSVLTPTLGNAWCGICPHGFVGKWLNRIGLRRSFPAHLRGVWIGLISLVLCYWVVAYAMPKALSASTRTTAWYFLVYSIAAFAFFYVYKDMAWCKHLCPLGRLLAAHGKVGVLQIDTDHKDCSNCRSFECAKSCAWHLSPFRFEQRNNMGQCTLCLDCVAACDSVHLVVRPPGRALGHNIVGADRNEMWVFVVVLAVAGVGIQFLHGLQHTPLKKYLPWNVAGDLVQGYLPFDAEVFRMGGLFALVFAMALTLSTGWWAYRRAAQLVGRDWRDTANSLACALAPLAIIGLIPHAVMMFATRNAHALANEVGVLLGQSWQVQPLAQRGDAWLGWLNLLPYVAIAWTLWLVWQRAGLLVQTRRLQWRVWAWGSAPVWLYASVMVIKLGAMLWMAPTAHAH